MSIKINGETLEKYNVIFIFGMPTSGKSSTTYNTFIRDCNITRTYDLTKITNTDKYTLIGWFDEGCSRNGLDSIERKCVGDLYTQITRIKDESKTVILEGNRCISRPLVNKLIDGRYSILFIYFTCKIDTIVERCKVSRDFGVEDIEREVAIINSSRTMCDNFMREYRNIDALVFDTSCINRDDFSYLKLYDLGCDFIKGVHNFKLW